VVLLPEEQPNIVFSRGGLTLHTLKQLREEAGLSQLLVATETGITQQAYSSIESGKRQPSVPVAKKIAAVLGFDWTRFYDDDEIGQDSA